MFKSHAICNQTRLYMGGTSDCPYLPLKDFYTQLGSVVCAEDKMADHGCDPVLPFTVHQLWGPKKTLTPFSFQCFNRKVMFTLDLQQLKQELKPQL